MAAKKKKQPAKRVTSSDVFEGLRKRFTEPAWALFAEVGNGTGFECARHIDAIAVALWPSRGLSIQGVEIKVSRSDWLKELANPKKADAIQRYCDFWWIATSPGIVEPSELPENWGHLELNGRGTLTVKWSARKLKPVALTRTFVAAVLRRGHESTSALVKSADARGYARGVADAPAAVEKANERKIRRLEELETSLAEFEAASGVKIAGQWNVGRIGETVKRIMYSVNEEDPGEILRRASEVLRGHAERLDEEAAALAEVKKKGAAWD